MFPLKRSITEDGAVDAVSERWPGSTERAAETPKVGISSVLVKAPSQKTRTTKFCPASFLTFGKFNCRSPRGRRRRIGAEIDLFSREEGLESKSVTDTRATTDKNDLFLNMGFKHGKKWVDKNGAKCKMEFGRITKNTRLMTGGHW